MAQLTIAEIEAELLRISQNNAKIGACVTCQTDIIKYLEKNKQSFIKITIRATPQCLGKFDGFGSIQVFAPGSKGVGGTYHELIIFNGKVYDNLAPGTPAWQYFKDGGVTGVTLTGQTVKMSIADWLKTYQTQSTMIENVNGKASPSECLRGAPPNLPNYLPPKDFPGGAKLPTMCGKTPAEIGRQLKGMGFKRLPDGFNKGQIWVKDLGNGWSIGVRIDPAVFKGPDVPGVSRPVLKGWADEKNHLHKEMFPTSRTQYWARDWRAGQESWLVKLDDCNNVINKNKPGWEKPAHIGTGPVVPVNREKAAAYQKAAACDLPLPKAAKIDIARIGQPKADMLGHLIIMKVIADAQENINAGGNLVGWQIPYAKDLERYGFSKELAKAVVLAFPSYFFQQSTKNYFGRDITSWEDSVFGSMLNSKPNSTIVKEEGLLIKTWRGYIRAGNKLIPDRQFAKMYAMSLLLIKMVESGELDLEFPKKTHWFTRGASDDWLRTHLEQLKEKIDAQKEVLKYYKSEMSDLIKQIETQMHNISGKPGSMLAKFAQQYPCLKNNKKCFDALKSQYEGIFKSMIEAIKENEKNVKTILLNWDNDDVDTYKRKMAKLLQATIKSMHSDYMKKIKSCPPPPKKQPRKSSCLPMPKNRQNIICMDCTCRLPGPQIAPIPPIDPNPIIIGNSTTATTVNTPCCSNVPLILSASLTAMSRVCSGGNFPMVYTQSNIINSSPGWQGIDPNGLTWVMVCSTSSSTPYWLFIAPSAPGPAGTSCTSVTATASIGYPCFGTSTIVVNFGTPVPSSQQQAFAETDEQVSGWLF